MKSDRGILRLFMGLIVLYLLYVVGKTLYQGYLVRKEVEDLKISIAEMQQSNKELSEKIIYYQSASYQERIARERMGMQKPGEQVLVILPEERAKTTKEDLEESLPNYQKWWNFFFKA